MNLREKAKGRDCLVRGPTCNYDPATTCLAHIRRAHVAGKGQKPHDLIACSDCHTFIGDGRREADEYIVDAWARTLDLWTKTYGDPWK